MPTFTAIWSAKVEADSHEDAATIALETLRDPSSIQTIFEVVNDDDNCLVVVDAHENCVIKDERGENYEYA